VNDVGVFVYELLDDFMFLAFGALVYSYSRQWFGRIEALPGDDERLSPVLDIRRSSEPG